MKKIRQLFKLTGIYLALSIISFYILIPFFPLVSLSFSPIEELRMEKGIFNFPENPTLDSILYVFNETYFLRNLLNSVIVGISAAFFGIIATMLASYAMTRFNYRGIRELGIMYLLLQSFPRVLILVPMYLIWTRFGLLNTYTALILTYCTFIFPLSVWMLRSYFQGIPQELDEQAMVDGCSRGKAFLYVVLPNASPGIIAVGLYAFVMAWQEFLFASTIMRDNEMATVTSGIYMFVGHQRTDWSPLAVQCLFAVIPVAITFVFLQKYFVEGMTAGAIKG